MQLGTGLNAEDLIFEEIPGEVLKPDMLTNAYRNFIKRDSLKHVTFHDLRHTHASHLLAQNIHPKIVSERLGHSTIKSLKLANVRFDPESGRSVDAAETCN